MAIQPIQQFQDPSNSLVQILQGGNQQIGSILDRAIQIGRDIANKRTQQEQDLAAMRNQETAMAQRRGENLQSVLENQRKFGMEEDKFDFLRMDTERKFGASRQDEAARAAERAAAMGQQQSQFDMNYGLSERRLGLEESRIQAAQAERDAERSRIQGSLQASPLPAPVEKRPGEFDNIGQFLTPPGPTQSAAADRPTLVEPELNVLSMEREYKDALTKQRDAERAGLTQEAEQNRRNVLYYEDKLSKVPRQLTESEARLKEKHEWERQDRATGKTTPTSLTPIKATASTAGTALAQAVEGSPDSFPNPYSERFAPKDEKDTAKEARQAQAALWEKDKAARERQSALGMKEDAYVDSVMRHIADPKSPHYIKDAAARERVAAERRRAWQLAQKEKAAQEALMGGSTPAASPVDTVLGMPGIR